MTVPDRGDLVVVDFDPSAGHEQAKRRPGLVLSRRSFNRTFGLAFIAPITTKPKGHALEIPLPAGLRVTGSVLVHHSKSFDWRARRTYIADKVPDAVVDVAADLLMRIVG
ncbi:MAG: type II toxin-antitoxin system PemK/MazF family toxin [Vulcanimicrobiaceae bacterium]|jgi:mRNA interferase MazF